MGLDKELEEKFKKVKYSIFAKLINAVLENCQPLWLFASLKGQCHKIFDTFFRKKNLPEPHMNRQKWFRETCLRIVANYEDTVPDTRTRDCQTLQPNIFANSEKCRKTVFASS